MIEISAINSSYSIESEIETIPPIKTAKYCDSRLCGTALHCAVTSLTFDILLKLFAYDERSTALRWADRQTIHAPNERTVTFKCSLFASSRTIRN